MKQYTSIVNNVNLIKKTEDCVAQANAIFDCTGWRTYDYMDETFLPDGHYIFRVIDEGRVSFDVVPRIRAGWDTSNLSNGWSTKATMLIWPRPFTFELAIATAFCLDELQDEQERLTVAKLIGDAQ